MIKRKCAAIVERTGLPCKSFRVNKSGLCVSHDPATREELIKMARAGGRTTYRKLPKMPGHKIKDLQSLRVFLEHTLTSCANGEMYTPVKEIHNLGKLYVDVLDKTEIANRLTEIEKYQTKRNA